MFQVAIEQGAMIVDYIDRGRGCVGQRFDPLVERLIDQRRGRADDRHRNAVHLFRLPQQQIMFRLR